MGARGAGQGGQGEDQRFSPKRERAAGRLGLGAGEPQGEAGAEHAGGHRRRLAPRRGGEQVGFAGQRDRQVGGQLDRLAPATQPQLGDLAVGERARQRGQQPPREQRRVVAAELRREVLA
jgi:hypothetical protein